MKEKRIQRGWFEANLSTEQSNSRKEKRIQRGWFAANVRMMISGTLRENGVRRAWFGSNIRPDESFSMKEKRIQRGKFESSIRTGGKNYLKEKMVWRGRFEPNIRMMVEWNSFKGKRVTRSWSRRNGLAMITPMTFAACVWTRKGVLPSHRAAICACANRVMQNFPWHKRFGARFAKHRGLVFDCIFEYKMILH